MANIQAEVDSRWKAIASPAIFHENTKEEEKNAKDKQMHNGLTSIYHSAEKSKLKLLSSSRIANTRQWY